MSPIPFIVPTLPARSTYRKPDIRITAYATMIARRILAGMFRNRIHQENRICEIIAMYLQKNLNLDAMAKLPEVQQSNLILRLRAGLTTTLNAMNNDYQAGKGAIPQAIHGSALIPFSLIAPRTIVFFPKAFKFMRGFEENEFMVTLREINKQFTMTQLFPLLHTQGLFTNRLPAEVNLEVARYFVGAKLTP